MRVLNRSIVTAFVLSMAFTWSAHAESAIERQVKKRKQAEELAQKAEVEKKLEIPQKRNIFGIGAEIAQDPHRNTNGLGRIELNTGVSAFGAPQIIQPTEKLDFSMPLLYNGEAGMSYSLDGVNPFNVGAKADFKIGTELAGEVSKDTYLVGGLFGGVNGDFGLNSQFRKVEMEEESDWLGRPYPDDYGYTYMKGNAYAGAEYGLMAGVLNPNLSLRGFVGKGTILGSTDEVILGEQGHSDYTVYGTQFLISNAVRGDLSAKVFNGSSDGIYKGEVYAKVSDDIWLGAKARLIDIQGDARVNSIGVGAQWTPNFSAGAK